MDSSGLFYFKGRTKRVIMRQDGHTVHSFPIEETAMLHEAVRNCCAVGIRGGKNSTGSIPVAFIVLNPGVDPSEKLVQELDAIALEHLSERNRALAYAFVADLPYTSMGKVAYKQLEEQTAESLKLYYVGSF